MNEMRLGIIAVLLLFQLPLIGQYEISTEPAMAGTATGQIHIVVVGSAGLYDILVALRMSLTSNQYGADQKDTTLKLQISESGGVNDLSQIQWNFDFDKLAANGYTKESFEVEMKEEIEKVLNQLDPNTYSAIISNLGLANLEIEPEPFELAELIFANSINSLP